MFGDALRGRLKSSENEFPDRLATYTSKPSVHIDQERWLRR